jgi:hypothetical protein
MQMFRWLMLVPLLAFMPMYIFVGIVPVGSLLIEGMASAWMSVQMGQRFLWGYLILSASKRGALHCNRMGVRAIGVLVSGKVEGSDRSRRSSRPFGLGGAADLWSLRSWARHTRECFRRVCAISHKRFALTKQ